MDFSTEFVAFRDRMIAGQDKTFVTEMNVQVAGRAAAAVSCFGLDGERKLLGLVPLGSKSHAHEYRLLFAAPELDRQSLKPDRSHEFSLVSVILVTGKLDPAVPKKLRKLAAGRDFTNIGQGWSAVRMAVVDLPAHKIYTNRMGDSMKNIIKPIL